MYKDYSKYQVFDFLHDDYFVETMLHPTLESSIFWKVLFESGKIDENVFLSAYALLKELHEQKPEVPEERIEILWQHITETNRKKQIKAKQICFLHYLAVACSIAGILFFSYRWIDGFNRSGITDIAKVNKVHTQYPDNQILLISGDHITEIEGTQVSVEHDTAGARLKINQQAVNFAQANAEEEQTPSRIYNELRVPYGKRAFLRLSDGSSIWVNTGTKVIYPSVFADDMREIYVEGEIYAEVFYDKDRPFFIQTSQLNIRVLGTILNVTAYKEDLKTHVVLVDGLIDVKPIDGKYTLVRPDQLFSYSEQSYALTTVQTENYTSWHKGIYLFKSEAIENILLRLARYYNVTMKLPPNPTGITVSGKLELKDDLSQILNGLLEIVPMNFVKKDNEYIIGYY